MDLSAVRNILNLAYAYSTVEEGWAASQTCYPQGPLSSLTEDHVGDALRFADVPEIMHHAFYESAAVIQENDALRRLFWHCQREVFVQEQTAAVLKVVPRPDASMGDTAGMFRALLMLSGIPFLKQVHGLRNIPDSYTRAAFRDLAIWIPREWREWIIALRR